MTNEPNGPTNEPRASTNPFESEEAIAASLIVQMRIYDVLLAMLTKVDEGAANKLIDLHANGKILGPLPYLNMGDIPGDSGEDLSYSPE